MDCIDLERYPLLSRDARWERLIGECRALLAVDGCCELPGFLTPAATAAMADEAEGLARGAYHSVVTGNAYLEPADASLPPDHPHRMEETTALGAVAYDQFPAASLLKHLYEWEPMIQFLAAVLGKERLFRYADPLGGLNLAVMKEGDYLRWHFDQTDFVTSIALQSAERGGDFEFVPNIRAPGRPSFDAVKRVLEGGRDGVKTIPMVPGTLVLFEGRYSIHRVTSIHGSRVRLVALLGYDTQPGVKSTEHLHYMRYGRTAGAEAV